MCVQLQKGEQSFISTSALCLDRFHSRLPPSSLKENCTQSPSSRFWQTPGRDTIKARSPFKKKVICLLFVALILWPSPLQVLSQWTRWPSRVFFHDQSSVFLFFFTGKNLPRCETFWEKLETHNSVFFTARTKRKKNVDLEIFSRELVLLWCLTTAGCWFVYHEKNLYQTFCYWGNEKEF